MPFDVGSAVGYLNLNVSGWNSGLKSAQGQLSRFNGQMSSAQSAWNTASTKMTSTGLKLTTAVTTPLVALGTKAVKTSATFESAMSQVQATMGATADSMDTLDGQTVNTMDSLSGLAKELGANTKFSAVEAAKAINNMAMAGYSVQEIYDSLPQVLSLASAGALDLDYATQLVANGLNVMGMGTEDATELADKLAVTSTKAYGSVSDFGEGLLVAGAQAKLANVSLTDTMTALGILGDNGISASEGGTYLRNTLKNLYTPTEKAADALNALGVTTSNQDGTLRDFQDVLQDLGSALDGLTEDERVKAMSNIFDSRTISAANALIKNSGERWDELSESIDGAAGSAKKMADTQLNNLDGQLTILKSSLEGLAIAFGSLIVPIVKKATGFIQKIVDWLNSLSKAQKEQILKIAAIVAALGPALIIFGKIIGALSSIGKVFSLVTSPVGLTITLIAALVAGFIYLWNTSKKFRDFFINLWNTIKTTVESVVNWFTQAWKDVSQFFTKLWNSISKTVTEIWDGIGQFFVDFWNNLTQLFSDAWQAITGFFSDAWSAIKEVWITVATWFDTNIIQPVIGFFSDAWQVITGFFADAWSAIKEVWITVATWFNENVVEPVKSFFAPIVEWFTELFTEIWDFIASVFVVIAELAEGCWEAIKRVWEVVSGWFNENVIQPVEKFFSDAWEAITGFFSDAWNTIKDIWEVVSTWFNENVIQPVITFFSDAWEAIINFFSEAWETIKTTWNVVSNWFNESVIKPIIEFFTNLWNTVKNAASDAWDTVKGVWSAVSTWFDTNVIQPVENFFSDAWEALKNGASDAWEGIKNVFGSVADWFGGIFADAWQAVKDVFSTGGQIFEGIKEGIAETFKIVVNAIIKGLNTVIALPFNGINKALKKIKNAHFLGISPFKKLIKLIDVPQIPLLARGGVLARGQVGLLEGDGAEAVVPLEQNTGWIKRISSELFDRFKVLLDDSGLLRSLQTFAVSAEDMIQVVRHKGIQAQKSEATINNYYNFYSPKEIDPIQARKMILQTAQQLALD